MSYPKYLQQLTTQQQQTLYESIPTTRAVYRMLDAVSQQVIIRLSSLGSTEIDESMQQLILGTNELVRAKVELLVTLGIVSRSPTGSLSLRGTFDHSFEQIIHDSVASEETSSHDMYALISSV